MSIISILLYQRQTRYDDKYDAAVRYAIGNTLLTDTLEEARTLAFENNTGDRYKIVTLDGTLIRKSGLITGGRSGITTAVSVYNAEEMEKLKDERDEIMKELNEIAYSEDPELEQQINSEITEIQNKSSYMKADKVIDLISDSSI